MEETKSEFNPQESPYTIPVKKRASMNFRRHVLVIGQTAHGKTTFVNGLFNYYYNTTPEKFIYIADLPNNKKNFRADDSFDFKNKTQELLFQEFNKRVENGEGVAQNCTKYNCKDEFIIYDTPGLSDGKGIEEDDKNIEKILISI